MRIAYVITGLLSGGAEVQLSRLAIETSKRYPVIVISLTGGGELAEELKKHHVPVVFLHVNPFNAVFKLRRALKEFKPDIVHAFLWHANMTARFAKIGLHAPVICTLLGKEPSRLRDIFEWSSRAFVDYYITNSHYLVTYFRLPRRSKVIYNGFLDSHWKGKKRKPIQKHAIMVGHLRWEKDYRTLIKAAALLPDWNFTIVGRGPREQELKTLIQELGVTNVAMLGMRTDVDKLLLKHECLVHLSFTEGSPLAIAEAMLLGVPVIASDIPALHELCNKRGMLVKPEDPKAVAVALQKLHRQAKSTAAVTAWARTTFSLNRMVQENEKVYKELSQPTLKPGSTT